MAIWLRVPLAVVTLTYAVVMVRKLWQDERHWRAWVADYERRRDG